jgi:YidC/Oxa1 family membrane protein insertase
MQHDIKNIILAIVLSFGIIFVWQYFVAKPSIEKQREAATQSRQQQPVPGGGDSNIPKAPQGETPATPSANVPNVPGSVQPAELVLAKTPRIKIDTEKLEGTINLQGAQLDDLRLKNYHETIDKSSPTITLLAPAGTRHGYFAQQGWSVAKGAKTVVPTTKTVWKVAGNSTLSENSPVVLTWDNGAGLTFKRTIAVDNRYMFKVTQEVTNNSDQPIALFPYSRVQRQEIPKLVGVFVIHEGLIGVLGDEVPELDYSEAKDGDTVSMSSTGGWVGITDKYWAVAAIPDQKTEIDAKMAKVDLGNGREGFQSHFILKKPLTIAVGQTGKYQNQVFAGAKVVNTLNDYQNNLKIKKFSNLVDWGWFYFITKPMFWLLHFIQGIIGNFGIAILLITVIVKALFFPLANKSYKSMAQMKKLQPKMEALKKRYGDDRAEMQKKTMELYKAEKVSPLSGCLPMLLQIPVFFSLYKVLFVTIEMRHAPFILWIKDLSAPDPTSVFNLFGLLPFTPPAIMMIGVLPLIMGITMWIQMKLNPAPTDPIQAQMFNIMPIAFTFMLGTFPAGLVLYWAWNNFLSIIQQYTIMKKQGVEITLMDNIRDSLPGGGKKKASK